MTDTATDAPPPVFSPGGQMQGNLTSGQGQPPSPLAPQSPLSAMGPPPAPTPPPQYPAPKPPPMPKAPTQQQLGPAPDAKDYQKNSMEFASAMAVIGAIANKFTRVSGSAALSAFAGAMKGWETGNLQAYETAAKQWEQNTKATLDNNRQIMDQYKLALENRKMNIDEQMSQIQLVATKYHDQMMYDAASSKNYTMVAQIYEKNAEFTQKAQLAADKLQEDRKTHTQQAEERGSYWLSPQGAARLEGPSREPGTPYVQGGPLSDTEKAKAKQLAEIYGAKAQKGGLPGELVAKENAERTARGEPAMTAAEEKSFIQSIHPPRSAPAMAVEAFKKDFQEKNGRSPNGDELKKFAGSYAGETSYGRTAGSQGARVESASNEVEQLIPQALEASRAYTREGGKYVGLNKLFQSYDQGTSDPKYNDFVLANFSLVNAYTRAMNPQGVPRIAERLEQHAFGILSTATNEKAYEVQVRRLWKEVQASKTATAKTAEGRTPGDINSPVPGMDRLGDSADSGATEPAKMSDDDLKKKLGL